MLCNELVSKIDEFQDGGLAAQNVREFEQHAKTCTSCGQLVADRQVLHQSLTNLPVEGPGDDFFERALDLAVQTQPIDERTWFERTNRAVVAVAAVLLIGIATLQTSIFTPSRDIPEVMITLHEVTPVNLRFTSEVDLEDARLSLQLPESVGLAGYTGRREFSWRTDLQEGNNLLRLPLLGNMASSAKLVATLDHPHGSKTFELQITVN